jgi:hypothetical protein
MTNRPGSWLSRVKLSEPVRLYVYGLGSVLVVALVMRGVLDGEYLEAMLQALAVAAGLGTAAEAARASVYSPASTVQLLSRARGSWNVQAAEEASL